MVEFKTGKWYGNNPEWKGFYIKCNDFDGRIIKSTEQIHLNGSGYSKQKNQYSSRLEGYKEIDILEIAQYLPKNHPDLLLNPENLLSNLIIW